MRYCNLEQSTAHFINHFRKAKAQKSMMSVCVQMLTLYTQ